MTLWRYHYWLCHERLERVVIYWMCGRGRGKHKSCGLSPSIYGFRYIGAASDAACNRIIPEVPPGEEVYHRVRVASTEWAFFMGPFLSAKLGNILLQIGGQREPGQKSSCKAHLELSVRSTCTISKKREQYEGGRGGGPCPRSRHPDSTILRRPRRLSLE